MKLLIQKPYRLHSLAACLLLAAALFLFVHPDIVETANHSYLLLESLFSGRFADFYNVVAAHENSLYYLNNAHYNVIVYLLFAVAELPVFIVCAIAGTAPSEALLYFLCKLVSIGFYLGCAVLVSKIAVQVGIKDTTAGWAALFFALWPPAFFSVPIMGQYDSLGVFFMLLGIHFWLREKRWVSILWFGVGIACKFFPLFVLIPLLLLWEKRPLHLLKYGVASLWLVLPTGLLFAGRSGDMGYFNQIMLGRLFEAELFTSAVPLFPVLFFVLCCAAWLYHPPAADRPRVTLWFGLAVFAALFLWVDWNVQWVLYLAPFAVLTTLLEKQRLPWHLLDILLAAGYFLLCAYRMPGQLEANLLNFGVVGLASGLNTALTDGVFNHIAFYYDALLPVLLPLGKTLFGGALAAGALFKFPRKGKTLASHLAKDAEAGWLVTAGQEPRYLWAVFGAGLAIWLLPTAFTWLKCFGFL